MTKNELVNNNQLVDAATGEIMQPTMGERVVQETQDYRIVQMPDGSFKKNMKYHAYFSRQAETEEEKIELYNVFNSNDEDSDLVIAMKNMINQEIDIEHVFIQPYESFDEKTGGLISGVTTTLQGSDGRYYATSSKSVYYTMLNIMKSFGKPSDENYKPVKVQVTGKKEKNGVQINLKLIGLA